MPPAARQRHCHMPCGHVLGGALEVDGRERARGGRVVVLSGLHLRHLFPGLARLRRRRRRVKGRLS